MLYLSFTRVFRPLAHARRSPRARVEVAADVVLRRRALDLVEDALHRRRDVYVLIVTAEETRGTGEASSGRTEQVGP